MLHIENVDFNLLPKIIQLHYQKYFHIHCKMKDKELVVHPEWDEISVNIMRLILVKISPELLLLLLSFDVGL